MAYYICSVNKLGGDSTGTKIKLLGVACLILTLLLMPVRPAAAASFMHISNVNAYNLSCLAVPGGSQQPGSSLIQTKPEDFEQQMKSSYFSSVYMTRSLALVYPKAKVINIVSNSALAAHKNNSAYGAAKAAQMHFFKALQDEFKPAQYQITNVYPSDIATHGANPEAIGPNDLATFIRH